MKREKCVNPKNQIKDQAEKENMKKKKNSKNRQNRYQPEICMWLAIMGEIRGKKIRDTWDGE